MGNFFSLDACSRPMWGGNFWNLRAQRRWGRFRSSHISGVVLFSVLHNNNLEELWLVSTIREATNYIKSGSEHTIPEHQDYPSPHSQAWTDWQRRTLQQPSSPDLPLLLGTSWCFPTASSLEQFDNRHSSKPYNEMQWRQVRGIVSFYLRTFFRLRGKARIVDSLITVFTHLKESFETEELLENSSRLIICIVFVLSII